MTTTEIAADVPAPTDTATGAAKAAIAVEKAALRDLLAPVRSRIRIAMALQLVASAATIVPYVAIAELGKTLLVDGPVDRSHVWWVVWLVVTALGVRAFFGGAALMVSHFADVHLQAVLRRRIADTLGRLPLGWFTRNSSGIVRKAAQNDIGDLHYLVAHRDVETVAAIATPLFGIAYAFWIDWRLGFLAVATIPIYAVTFAVLSRRTPVILQEMNAGIAAISTTIVEFVSGISVVKTYGRTGEAHSRYRDAAADFGRAYRGWVGPVLRTAALASMALSAPVVLLVNLAVGTWFVRNGWVSTIDLVTTTLIAMAIPSAIMAVSYGARARADAAAAAGRLTELYATPALPQPDEFATPTGHSVEFRGVGFAYDGTNRVLDGIDLTLAEGTVTALVGASGSGKSTLATLVPRFHDPDEGTVTIGGVDVAHIDPATLYHHVGFVLQDVQLLATSILDNIRLARPDATLEQVRAAARAARIDDRITELPKGYDSVVGADVSLSGGEAQRVSIARAILADTPILVLDEATAYADPESEAQIQDALANLTIGRTLLVIAHRLDSIVTSDRIVVLDRGRIVEQGTHTTLLDAHGHYRRMWDTHHARTRGER